jgi:4-amino-4-deoxy-L-arabinose transferase-like glycosyltransferase
MRSRPVSILLVLLAVHAGLLGWEAFVHSPTIDEVEWLPGGLVQWKTGRGDIVVRNPPHVGSLAAIPLLLADPDTSALDSDRDARSIGREFIRANGERSFWLFTLGRWACIPFSLVGAIVCYAWGKELYSWACGLFAAALWCFCPNILAHGQLVAHDVASSSLGLVACYAFWRWLRAPSVATTLSAGVCLGVALLTKMTMLIHLGLWPLMWIAWRVTGGPGGRSIKGWLAGGAALLVVLFLAIDVLNLAYGFQGSLARLDSYRFRSAALTGNIDGPGNRFAESPLGQVRVPLPRAFLAGLDQQRFSQEGGSGSRGSYLRGVWSTGGSPYWYLYALAIKVPLGTWCLLLLGCVFRLRHVDGRNRARDELILLAPAIAVLLVASKSAGFADHLRYVLPCFPFVFIWISRLANVPWSSNRLLRSLTATATAWSVTSSLWIYPHELSYFNELVGGPRHGHEHLVSSNIDYGQDLLKLKQWYDLHPEARPLGLAYWDMDSVDPRLAGIEYFKAPSGPAPGEVIDAAKAVEFGPRAGWYAVNVNALHGDLWPGRSVFSRWGHYGYFLNFEPVAQAGYSIYIYHLTDAETRRVRKSLGVPPTAVNGNEPPTSRQ